MKTLSLCASLALLAACSPATESPAPTAQVAAPAPSAAPAPAPAAMPARTADASGVIDSLDTAAGTVTITHGPVPALDWPGMTMTFQAPGVDLTGLQAGDPVAFQFTSTGMNGTIVSIRKQ